MPLTDEGQPQLPATPATRQRVLLAMLAAARCRYICPSEPCSDTNFLLHLAAYEARFSEQELACCCAGGGGSSSGDGTAAGDGAPLSGLIRVFTEAANSAGYVQLAWQAAGWVGEAANWPVLQRQLDQLAAAAPSLGGQLPGLLAGAALPSVQQLRYTTWLLVHEMSSALLCASAAMAHGLHGASDDTLQLTPAQAHLAQLAEQQAAAMLMQLEPDSLRSHLAAGDMAAMLGDAAASAQHFHRCIKLSQALPSRYWRIRAACSLLNTCGLQLGPLSPQARSLLELAVEEIQRAQRRLDVCKKRLPLRWTDAISSMLAQLTPLVEAARARLLGNRRAGPHAALRQIQEQLKQTGIPARSCCEGCGETAVGLRACGGCRKAHYCSADCQRRAWPSHKQACKAARAAAAAAAPADS